MDRGIVPLMATIFAVGAIGGLLLYAQIDRKENSRGEQTEETIAVTELPIGVQKMIQSSLGGGMVSKTTRVSTEARTYYEAEVQRPGAGKIEIKISEDGRLIGTGDEEPDNDLGIWPL